MTKSSTRKLTFALLEPPGQHDGHGDLQDLAGLDDQRAQRQPTGGALARDAPQRRGHQQGQPHRVQRHRQLLQLLRRHLGHHKQHGQRQQHVAAVVDKARAVVVSG
jgi:hypothetical protein